MSKRFQKVLTNMVPVSFLETIETNAHMKKVIEVKFSSDEAALSHGLVRIRIHHEGEYTDYDITLNERGEGQYTIDDLDANMISLEEIDREGNCVETNENRRVLYFVNDEQQQGCANVWLNDGMARTVIRIVHEQIKTTMLHLEKRILRQHQEMIPGENERFLISVQGPGMDELITLDASNGFHVMEKVLCGTYTIMEMNDLSDVTYCLDGKEHMDCVFELTKPEHQVLVINEADANTSVRIEQVVRDAQGNCYKPDPCDCFHVTIISQCRQMEVVLDASNEFCVVLHGLCPGSYSFEQPNGDYASSFIVDDGYEKPYGYLDIEEDQDYQVLVVASTMQAIQQESQLRICKYIRTKDGCLIRPGDTMNFQVTIEGCGMCQTMNLNASNNFCVDIASLCNGCYDIFETPCEGYATSYVINEDMERTSAQLFVRDHQCYLVNIINSQKHAGSLYVNKYIRNEYGDLARPSRGECFDLTLSSYFCKKCFTLNAENDWSMCFTDLKLGTYEIRECEQECYRVEYQVDGKMAQRHARFVMDGCDREVKVVNVPFRQTCGTLRISKYEETPSHELVKPPRDECYHVIVESDCFKEVYTLKASNNWCIALDGLEPGEYHIYEEEGELYDASYVLNGMRCHEACIIMGSENQEISILNHRMCGGTIEINAMMENCSEQRTLPQAGLSMDILVEGKEHCYHVTLSKENDWCVLLEDLPADTYRIIQKETFGFEISYEVDGCRYDFARIAMNKDTHQVTILNTFASCSGIVSVHKYIEDAEGNLCMPCADEEFCFELKGRDVVNTYTLCKQNDFSVCFDDLREGCYEISEVEPCGEVSYLLNKQPYRFAKFTLDRGDIVVDIINHMQVADVVNVEKRICINGELCMPEEDDCFKVALSGRNTYQVFELNKDNAFCVQLEGLENQHYELKELCACHKSYEIDGCEQEDGYFLYEGCAKHIVIINHPQTSGALRIEKLIEDTCGNLSRPQRWESFEVMIESETYKRTICLDAGNAFCETLYDVPCGHYEIKELDNGCGVCYVVCGMPCESAIVDIIDQDVSVSIINKEGPLGSISFQGLIERGDVVTQAEPKDEFVLHVCHEETSFELVLHAGNDFCASLENLIPGSYIVTEAGQEDVIFALEDQRFSDAVCIELQGECVEASVIKCRKGKPNLTIQKWMWDGSGKRYAPCHGEVFMMSLSHHGKKVMFELNQENQYTKVLKQQQPGLYELKEESGHASYQIDQGAIQSHAKFELGRDMRVDVLNQEEQSGILCIAALIEDQDETFRSPDRTCSYEVVIHGENTSQCLTLSKDNSFKQRIELPFGTYVLECDAACYLMVDHHHQQNMELCLCKDEMMVQMVMKGKRCGSLMLQKYIRGMDCDCFKKPNGEQEYEIEVRGEQFYQMVYLNQENRYQACIDNLVNGCYTVCEVGATASYIVDGGKESHQASIEICHDTHDVKIINETDPLAKGSIEICKLIRDEEGCYRYPEAQDSYWISIKGEQGTSRVLLNEANHFYASVRNLREGWYEVSEEEARAEVLYVVNNGAPMKKGIVHVMNNANTVNVINPIQSMTGSIQICKWVEINNRQVKPEQGEYRIYISKPEYNQSIVLNQANNYCETIMNLEAGTYVINEIDGGNVTYIVDERSETDRAIVDVNGSAHNVEVINHPSATGGSITFLKFVRENGEYDRPKPEESFEFYLSAPGYQNTFVLNQANDWTLTLQNLSASTYVLSELNGSGQVTYVVDSQSEVDRAIIEVKDDAHHVAIINNTRPQQGSIQINKFVRNNNVLETPPADKVYQLHVSKPGYNEVFTLNQDNQFTLELTNLEDGLYVLDELGEGEVSYIINGSSETVNGIVEVKGNRNQVTMINTSAITTGSIYFRKFIKNADGSNSIPADGDEYTIEVYNAGFLKRVHLNAQNRFQSTLYDLKEGVYYLRELDASEFRVTYRINGGEETSEGNVFVQRDQRSSVDVYNERRENINTIEVFKYMLDKDGNYLPPSAPDTYDFRISGNGVEREYHLEVANDWHVTITDLASGTYRIEEITQDPNNIRYLINSAVLQKEAVFTATSQRTNVIGIINLLPGVQNGEMTLSKVMRNAQGELVAPMNNEAFVIQITGEQYDRLVSLDAGNNYTYTLNNLAYGNYLIEERDASYVVTYRVNGGAENTIGSLNIEQGGSNEVVIINSSVPSTTAVSSASTATSATSAQSVKIILE